MDLRRFCAPIKIGEVLPDDESYLSIAFKAADESRPLSGEVKVADRLYMPDPACPGATRVSP